LHPGRGSQRGSDRGFFGGLRISRISTAEENQKLVIFFIEITDILKKKDE
jgi:hypothetical protein